MELIAGNNGNYSRLLLGVKVLRTSSLFSQIQNQQIKTPRPGPALLSMYLKPSGTFQPLLLISPPSLSY